MHTLLRTSKLYNFRTIFRRHPLRSGEGDVGLVGTRRGVPPQHPRGPQPLGRRVDRLEPGFGHAGEFGDLVQFPGMFQLLP